VPARDEAMANHSILRTLCDGGATLLGAAAVDPFGASGRGVCINSAHTGNPANPGRAIFGSNGALAALVASGSADVGLGVDSGCDVAVPAACVSALAFRCSHGSIDLQDGNLLMASSTCAALVLVARTAAILTKV
jgi:Asp-tRNA(Asn)/Glu-tRNA(Gln) amidotransferase A subunit family amidase